MTELWARLAGTGIVAIALWSGAHPSSASSGAAARIVDEQGLTRLAMESERVPIIIELEGTTDPPLDQQVSATALRRAISNAYKAEMNFARRVRRLGFEWLSLYRRIRDNVRHGVRGPVPTVMIEITSAAELEQIRGIPGVISIAENRSGTVELAQSVPKIGGPTAAQYGWTGRGQTVAIIDTGVDKTHPFLAGKVIGEACYSEGTFNNGPPYCPNGRGSYPGAGVPCSWNLGYQNCWHGTMVAGVAAGKGPDFNGVAPEATVLSVQGASATSFAGGAGITEGAIIDGLSWVLGQSSRGTAIAAVNLSVQINGSLTDSACDSDHPVLKRYIDWLRNRGIATVAATGNDGSGTGIIAPACISSAIAVGATTDSDQVAGFSNNARNTTMLAPGESITSSAPTSDRNNPPLWQFPSGFHTSEGTSFAAPHVTGAWAVLKQAKPDATVDDVRRALIGGGAPIADPRNGLVANVNYFSPPATIRIPHRQGLNTCS